MPECIECVDDCSLLIADHRFLEINANRGQIFRDIADVLVLGAAGQDLAPDQQERGRDNPCGGGRASHPSRISRHQRRPSLASREAFQGRGMEENFQVPETRARRPLENWITLFIYRARARGRLFVYRARSTRSKSGLKIRKNRTWGIGRRRSKRAASEAVAAVPDHVVGAGIGRIEIFSL
jgi:hypothetical protein